MIDLLTALTEMAAALADGDEAGAERIWKSVSVAERGLISALLLAAADRDINQKQISDVGRFSRSHFTPSDKPSRRLVAQHLGGIAALSAPVVDHLLGAARPARTLAEVEADLRQRDQTIHELRTSLDRAHADRQLMAEYARSVHQQHYPHVLENLRTRDERVVDARPRFVALRTPEDDDERPDNA